VNDVLAQGAEPLFFLDYFACGKLDAVVTAEVIRGIARGCELAGCALIGGETAEMPGMHADGEYDLAGFCVGVVEKDQVISGSRICSGDAIIGLASNGIHSNGYSLVRRVISEAQVDLEADLMGSSVGALLMEPTRIYVKSVLALIQAVPVKGIAHITGGGIPGNVPRILPSGLRAVVETRAWKLPAVFEWLRDLGGLDTSELFRVFNCGIGMVLVLSPEHVGRATDLLGAMGETVHLIGHVDAHAGPSEVVLA